MLDFLFIKPGNQKILYGETSFKLSAIEPPYWPLLLGSYLKNEGKSVKIIDLEVTAANVLIEYIIAKKPINIIICVSGHNPNASLMNMTGLDELTDVIKVLR